MTTIDDRSVNLSLTMRVCSAANELNMFDANESPTMTFRFYFLVDGRQFRAFSNIPTKVHSHRRVGKCAGLFPVNTRPKKIVDDCGMSDGGNGNVQPPNNDNSVFRSFLSVSLSRFLHRHAVAQQIQFTVSPIPSPRCTSLWFRIGK